MCVCGRGGGGGALDSSHKRFCSVGVGSEITTNKNKENNGFPPKIT